MRNKRTTLVIICGLPGAGKTTLSKKLSTKMPAVRFCPDEWMEDLGITLWDGPFRDKLEKRFWELGKELLQRGQSVILEYGFWNRSERDDKLKGARVMGVNIELHYLDIPNDELKHRLEKRGMEGDDAIIAGKLDEWSESFERPDADEFNLYDNHSDQS